MNEKIERLAVISGVLNYVDNETPRVYFVSGNADCEDVEYFAKMIINECLEIIENADDPDFSVWKIKKDFGIE